MANARADLGGLIAIAIGLWLLLGLLFAWLGMVIARGKGQNTTLGGVLGFLLGIIGLIIVLCLPTLNTGRRSRRRGQGRGRTGTSRVGITRSATGRGTGSHGRGTGGYRRRA